MNRKFAANIKRIVVGIVTVIGLTIFGYLTWYSFRFTYNFIPEYSELFDIEKDNLFLHCITLVICILSLSFFGNIGKDVSENTKLKAEKFVLIFAMLSMTIAGILWVSVVHAQPCTDQRWVVEGACSLMDGDYRILEPDQYFGTYTYQLCLAVIFRFLFTISGVRDYRIIQYCNVLCIPVIVLAGYKIVKNLGGRSKSGIFYCLLIMTCFPLLLYTPFVYGEIFSVMAGMVFVWGLMAFVRGRQKKWMPLVVVSAVFGVLTRGNFWIVIIAACIILMLCGLWRKDGAMLLLMLLIVVMPICMKNGIELIYEQRSGLRLDQGTPFISTIAMGVHDEGNQPAGWSNLHDYYAYALNDCDREKAAEFSKEYLRIRMAAFREGSADWKAFYKEKLLTQWEEPTWQSLLANHDFAEEPGEVVNSIYYGNLKNILLGFLNEYQWLLYVGVCLFFWYCFIKKVPFYMLLPEIILIGGVLFSLLWEAKTRYSFPYMIYMLPCMSIGLVEVSEMIFDKIRKSRKWKIKKKDEILGEKMA